MPVLSATTEFPGWVSVYPRPVSIKTNDSQATVLGAGYLNSYVQSVGQVFTNEQMALVETTENSGVSYNLGWYQISISGANTSLVAAPGGSVQLPVAANHIATFVNTAGEIGDQAVTAIQKGSLQAGLSGTAGTLISYPSTASKGSLVVAAVNNTGNTVTTISNAAMGQASVISIPDPGAATANFAIAPSALVSGNVVKASGTAGLLVDAGYFIKAGVTGTYAGGGTSNAFTATGLTSSSIVTAVIATSTNAVSICKAVPSTNTLTVTFSADPGAGTTVYWIATSAAV